MGSAKDYRRDLEKLIRPFESMDEKRREESSEAFVKQLEADRKKVGMKPFEFFRIAKNEGPQHLRVEIDRRLKASTKNLGSSQPTHI
jgi:hypothetical protein